VAAFLEGVGGAMSVLGPLLERRSAALPLLQRDVEAVVQVACSGAMPMVLARPALHLVSCIGELRVNI
jgi:hypothetical protein